MAIPESKVLEIKEAADIVDVISTTLPLKRAGVNLKGLCPFHDEKTPSFIVSPDRQTYHCFGCGAGGDVYTFLMAQERLDFPGAVRHLADRMGVTIEEEEGNGRYGYRLLEFARKFYCHRLREGEAGRQARSYLEGRGISRETAVRFDIGYAPGGGRDLVQLAEKRGLSPQAMEDAGLVMRRGGEVRDRFWNRLMFPIHDERGRTVGFGGRILGRGEPKYLNSPEGPLFSKRKVLYGMHLARDSIKKADRVIVVEGYTDVILAHQEGQTGVVGCLGTAFTERQASLLRRHTQQVVLVYDPDSAGVAASERGLDVLLSKGLDVKVAHLPKGKDPFDFLQQEGVGAFEELLQGAEDFFEFKLRAARSRHDVATSAGEAAAAQEVVSTLRKVSDPIRGDILFRRASEALGISEEALRASGQEVARRPRRTAPSAVRIDGVEEALLEILLHRPDLAKEVVSSVSLETFSEGARPVAGAIYEQVRSGGGTDVPALLVRLKEEQYCRVLVEAQEGHSGEKDYEKEWDDIQKRLREKALESRYDKLREDLDRAKQQDDKDRADQIFRELASCIQERKNIRS